MKTTTNKHHIVHNRQEWSMRPSGVYIREQPTLIAKIEKDLHDEIHRECPAIPLLGYLALDRTAHLFIPGHNLPESVDNLQFAIQEANKGPKVHPIDKQLGELAIEALQLQKPFLDAETGLRLVA